MTLLIALLALLMGTVLGLLGGGGSIMTLPILVYVAGVDPANAIAASLVVVGSTAAVSTIARARQGHVRWKVGLSFGAVAMVGAYVGGRVSDYLPGWLLLSLFAALMIVTSTMMLRGKKAASDAPTQQALWQICLQGLFVGSLTGLIGAGGGFLVVPALVLFAGLPMHQAVGTSLMVITLNSGSGLLGHLSHADVPWQLTLSVAGIAIVGSLVGAAVSSRMPAQLLRKIFAWFVLSMGLFILAKELSPMLGGPLPAGLAAAGIFVLALAIQLRALLVQGRTSNVPAR